MSKKFIRVILTQNVKNLGLEGEIKEVALGYARNYLLPKGLAEIATLEVLSKLQAQKVAQAKKEEEERKEALRTAKKLEELIVTVPVKVDKEGKLFGSVTSSEVAKALKDQAKIEIDKKAILLDEPIKKVGEYKIKVKLFKDVETFVKIEIKEKK